MTPPYSGLLNINKPGGLTSHDVVNRVRKLADQRKVGHAGTLDPLATGVLLVCLGQATRLIEYIMPGWKQYRAVIRFGITTDTLDAEGTITGQHDPSTLTESQLRRILPAFVGQIDQIPPIYSAIKQGGQPLYKRARAGQPVEVKPRPVTIDSITWLAWQPPELTLDITCSSGTYIRALARDIGEAAGIGAHLVRLIRTASGPWRLEKAVELARLEQAGADWIRYLHPPDRAITHLPPVHLDEAAATAVSYGRQVELPEPPQADLVRAYTPAGKFLAILTPTAADAKLWQPKKVFQATYATDSNA